MSRVGRKPIEIPAGVEVKINGNVVEVKGPKGTLSQEINKNIKVELNGTELTVSRPNDEKENKAMHGLYRQLINNMIVGVTKGFSRSLTINGVGYSLKIAGDGKSVDLAIGYSHHINVKAPEGITFSSPENLVLVVSGCNKEVVGQVASNIRKLRVPDPYHGYGIRYTEVPLKLKQGKRR